MEERLPVVHGVALLGPRRPLWMFCSEPRGLLVTTEDL